MISGALSREVGSLFGPDRVAALPPGASPAAIRADRPWH